MMDGSDKPYVPLQAYEELKAENERLREALKRIADASASDTTFETARRIARMALAPHSEPCHICGRRRDEPGEMYCSAAHPLAANSEAGSSET